MTTQSITPSPVVELARLHATAHTILHQHTAVKDQCVTCGCKWPCQPVCLAVWTIEVLTQ